ncbi:MAG TPA: HD domain-containing phosphohydrolase [Candidatus Dormibacteraeota bacterium]|jgi:putative nucleotidyltransferase with HDIG domain|nr:HD domain-containing phosphohydrolase [Candidatus Dormibacteraeota bacterium]
MFRHPSLRRRIVLPFIVLVVFVGAVGIAVISAQVGGSVEGAVDNGLVRSSLRSNDRLAAVENDRLQQLRAATNTTGIDSVVARGDGAAAGRLLGPIVGNAQPEHLVLRVLDKSGRQLVGLSRNSATVESLSDGAVYTLQAAVQHALRGERDALGDKYIFVASETPPMLYWVAPIWTETETPAVTGAVLLGQSLTEIAQTITGSSSLAVGFYRSSGTVLASSVAGSPSLSSDVRHEVTPDTPVRVATQWGGRPYRLLVNDWTMRGTQVGYLAVAVPADDLSGSLNAIRLVLVALFGAIALGTILIGLALADRITRPIDQLVASMRVVSAGDYSRRVQVESPDEIGYLATTFNEMTAALQEQIRARDEAYFRNLEALARAIDARDPYTFEHSARVAAISLELAKGMNLAEADLVVLRRAGLLHDVGKIGVSDKILAKTGPLNDEEWAAIRRHPVIGYEMLKDVPFLQPSLDPIRHHHERWDGEGYPDGLEGASISQLARIVTLADAFDAMTSDRPYRKGFSFEFAARTMISEAGRQFDPAVVDAFKARQAAIFARLEEMGKKPSPHASDIRLDPVA